MSERLWPSEEPHPSSGVLLLQIERELGEQEAAAVERHLTECWECRARCDELQKGIYAFVALRRDAAAPLRCSWQTP